MQCSRCSDPISPIVALDIDGTLGDYHGHLFNFACQWLGVPAISPVAYTGSMPYGDWFCAVFGVDMTTFRTIKLAYRQGGIKRWMPPMAGVKELMGRLTSLEVEVWICTTRPWARIDSIDPDTRFWIERNVVSPIEALGGLLYGDDKYQQLYDRVWPERVVAVLDDLPDQVEHAAELFGSATPILVRNQYNSSCGARITAASLVEAASLVTQRILRWRSEHA